ncbi:NADH-quinone oxidoreductase subunit L [Bogoriella caseilytica]|nr:NADH-quinone oxidoreductase subunit L [Bogoriella caseilytica]
MTHVGLQTSEAATLASLSWLLIAIPLASAAVLLLLGRRADGWGHWLGVLACGATAVLGTGILIEMLGLADGDRVQAVHLFSWIPAGDFSLDAGLLVDPLTVVFIMLVTVVSTLIHVYSVAYMEHDPNRRRFFAYLNLFVAAMLLLVLADSYALLFVGWEGVGLASYLLIGFWQHERANHVAAKKAFVMNRVGDAGLILAMGGMFAALGSVGYETVLNGAEGLSQGVVTFIVLMLLLGACGKSAQVPLQAWLGDAMAGPTPVSALIHAATMVTAGIYVLVRSAALLEQTTTAMLVIAIVGAVTLVFGAIVGSAKDDIKKVLAASTMSQLGYMMLAVGLGPVGFAFAIFHLFTHGFFKAGMFLGAGSVMHAMNDDVDMRRFGALRGAMLVTWLTFMAGWLAILGVPPFAGFFSKDLIIEAAFAADTHAPWILGPIALLGAGLTAFYMSRLFFMTFHGTARWSEDEREANKDPELVHRHPHESTALMTVPMIILAVGSVFLGLVLAVVFRDGFVHFLEPVLGYHGHPETVIPVWSIQVLVLAVVLLGAVIAWFLFGAKKVPATAPEANVLVTAARQDLYQDAVNEGVFMRPGQGLTVAARATDHSVIDGAVHGLARGTAALGQIIRKTQTGYVRSYAALMLGGVVLTLAYVLFTRV